jgi:hypothetical protein
MTNEQKDLTTPTKTDANQNKDGKNTPTEQKKEGQNTPTDQKGEDGTTKSSEQNEKVKPKMNETEKEREGLKHPHETSEPVASKAGKDSM